MIKRGRCPGSSSVTSITVLTKLAVMVIIRLMTGITGGRCALEDVINVTSGTGCTDMCASQLENRNVVVKRGRFPGRSGVAGCTILAQ